jgi:probable F420-dependent oxidoreductase
MVRPLRFALQTSSAPDMKAWRERARQTEDLGYSCLYIPDHFGDQYGPLVALTVAAEATSTLRVGSLVFDNDFRHPVVLAKEIAALDVASSGRVEFGLGAGWMVSDYTESGMRYDEASVRVDRMEEALAVYKALWSGGTATLAGTHYQVQGARCVPGPFTQPHPPILIGGGGKRVLTIAAREADIVGVNANLRAGYVGPEVAATITADQFDRRLRWVREAADERFDQLELQVLTFFVMIVPNREETVERVAPMFGVTTHDALEIPIALVGTLEQICETLIERRERWGFNYIVIHEAELEAFAPVVERLAGT